MDTLDLLIIQTTPTSKPFPNLTISPTFRVHTSIIDSVTDDYFKSGEQRAPSVAVLVDTPKPKDSQSDNIQWITELFSKVDSKIGLPRRKSIFWIVLSSSDIDAVT
ncbi:hypothetical protein HK097_005377, partial [Rhizophlyctis rosea]